MTSPLPFTRRTVLGLLPGAAIAGLGASEGHAKPKLRVVDTITSTRLPKVRRKWPMPKDRGQVFFIQRSMNPNTVVYAARYDNAGNLERRPLTAYWRRYAEEGQKRDLFVYERVFAYGISARRKRQAGRWSARFAALPDLPAELRQNGPNDAALWSRIEGRDYRLIYGFLDLDESGMIPKVERLRLVTHDKDAGQFVTHMISVSGGEIH